MSSLDRPGVPLSIPLRCACVAVAVAAILVLTTISTSGWQPSILVRMGAGEPMAQLASQADPDFRFVNDGAHYDGVYFYAIADDPLATGAAHTLIDKSAYRYGHPGYGWLGWLFSFGQTSAIPLVLLALGLVAIGAAAAGTSLLAAHLGWTPWAGLAVAFHPGLMYSLTALTSETVGAAFLVFALLFWVRGQNIAACATIVALCFTKEPFLLVPFGLAIWEGIRWLRDGDTPRLVDRVGLLSVGPVMFIAYYFYLNGRFGEWPFEATEGFFAFPFMGWLQSIREASVFAVNEFFPSQVGAPSGPLLVGAGAAVVYGMFRAVRLRSPIDIPFLLIGLLTLSLQPIHLMYPKDMIREFSIPLLLLVFVIPAVTYLDATSTLVEDPGGAGTG